MELNFNTSNVTIQRVINTRSRKNNHISIHLMLLFNATANIPKLGNAHFNTSNVTIQLLFLHQKYNLLRISIHLMLLFNCNLHQYFGLLQIISIHLMLLFNLFVRRGNFIKLHFNTSNVTIQLNTNSVKKFCISFQYI